MNDGLGAIYQRAARHGISMQATHTALGSYLPTTNNATSVTHAKVVPAMVQNTAS